MSEQHAHDGHGHGGHSETLLESDKPANLWIFVAIVAGIFIVGGMARGVDEFVNVSVREEQAAKLGDVPDALRSLRAQEEARAGKYQWIDRKTNVVRIPAERALEIVLRERAADAPAKPAAPAPAAPEHGAAPAQGEPAAPAKHEHEGAH